MIDIFTLYVKRKIMEFLDFGAPQLSLIYRRIEEVDIQIKLLSSYRRKFTPSRVEHWSDFSPLHRGIAGEKIDKNFRQIKINQKSFWDETIF